MKNFLTGALILGCLNCSKDEEKAKMGTINLNLTSDSSSSGDALAQLTSMTGEFRDLPLAGSTTEGLMSLKMYFRSIQICESIEQSGSGYTNTVGCVDIYANPTDTYNGITGPTAEERTTFEASTPRKFYDILSATDRAELNTGVEVPVGSYNFGIIETHPWVKIKAKSGTLCTKAGGAVEKALTGGDGIVSYKTTVDTLECGSGDPEEVLTYITNANTNFKFLAPFVVAEGDAVTLDLAFNMDKEVRALEDSQGGNLYSLDTDNSFYVPMIRIGAAPRKADDSTKVETYTLGDATLKEQIRVSLYYNSADDEKSILGINATVLGTAASTESKANKSIYVSSVEQDGDAVTLKDWKGSTVMSFTRGVAGTATYTCEKQEPYMLEECEGKTTSEYPYSAPTDADL